MNQINKVINVKKLQIIRKSVHNFSMLSIILGAFGIITVAGTCYVSIGYFRLICPVGFIELSLATHTINTKLIVPFLTISVLLFLAGRSFCSWGCPTSYMGGIIRKMTSNETYKKYTKVKNKVQKYVPQPGMDDIFVMMIGTLIGIFVFQYPLPCTICPLGIISRALIETVNHSTITHFHIALRYDTLLLIIPIVSMFLFVRGWSQVCPVGSLKGLMSTYNKTIVPSTTEACVNCKLCEQVCPVNIGHRRGLPDMSICIKCMLCAEYCPQHAIDIVVLYEHKKTKFKEVKDVNVLNTSIETMNKTA